MNQANATTSILDRFSLVKHEWALLICLTCITIGLYYSRALLSIGDVILFIVAIGYRWQAGHWRTSLWNRWTIPFLIIIGLYVWSAMISEDFASAGQRLKSSHYYLTIPLSLSMLSPLSTRVLRLYFWIYVFVALSTVMFVLIQFLQDPQTYIDRYHQGQVMPTPVLHIWYSYLIGLACVLSFVLIGESVQRHWKRIALICFVVLTVFIHILAVRTGVLGIYLSLFFIAASYIIKGIQIKKTLIITFVLIVGVVASWYYIPTIQNRWQYMRYDLEEFGRGEHNYLFSDHLRLMSIQNGLRILDKHKWLGAGLGDIDRLVNDQYSKNYPDVPPHLRAAPINQFVFSFTLFGIPAGTLFFLCLLFPMLYKETRGDPYILGIYGMTVASWVGDCSFEFQLGKSAFMMTLLTLLYYRKAQKSKEL